MPDLARDLCAQCHREHDVGVACPIDPLLRTFNPSCGHDRTSYDIMTCEACAEYTQRMWVERMTAAVEGKETK